MGIEITLTDRQFPVSPAFIRFLAQRLELTEVPAERWPDQVSEDLVPSPDEPPGTVERLAEQVMNVSSGREWVARAYELFVALLAADPQALTQFQSRFRFITVSGIPRSGGSYLTAEFYKSLHIDPYRVPHALAHDSFPHANPYALSPDANSWITTLRSTAEFMTMVEIFFATTTATEVTVPKKLTQSLYAWPFFQHVFGPRAAHFLTVRHPAAACISTYEKSGGLPAGGRFRVRSNIEAWCRRDLQHSAWLHSQPEDMDYFSVYLRYWELYYLRAAADCAPALPGFSVVPFEPRALQQCAQRYHDRHRSELNAAPFQVRPQTLARHPAWAELSRPAIARVAAAWDRVGMPFPFAELAHIY